MTEIIIGLHIIQAYVDMNWEYLDILIEEWIYA